MTRYLNSDSNLLGEDSIWEYEDQKKDFIGWIMWRHTKGALYKCLVSLITLQWDSEVAPKKLNDKSEMLQYILVFKLHIFWEGHKILRNLHLTFDWHYVGQK